VLGVRIAGVENLDRDVVGTGGVVRGDALEKCVGVAPADDS
jgi:hypothetical protein